MTPAKLQSETIDLLRFPLALMVVFIHMPHKTVGLIGADFDLISRRGIFDIIQITFSDVLPRIAVPAFFLISGYLFFVNFQQWSWDGYRKKMKSRVKTLLIPYILWNAVPFLMMVLAMMIVAISRGNSVDGAIGFLTENSWHAFYDCHDSAITTDNWLSINLPAILNTTPYNGPLWFLRDLIVVSVLSPVIYYAIKKLRISIIILLFVAYISRIWPPLSGFSIAAFFFFSLGAYFALNKIDIVQFTNRYKLFFISASVALLIATVIFFKTATGGNLLPLYVCTGVFSAFYIASKCLRKYNLRPKKLLVSSCFFIYALHDVEFPHFGVPIWYVFNALHQLIPGDSSMENGICYLASPFVTAFACILVFVVMRKLLPKTTSLFSGNR